MTQPPERYIKAPMVGKNRETKQLAYLEAEEIQKLMLWWMPWVIRNYIDSQEASYTIPPKSDVADPWPVDRYTYKERHLVECFFQKLKWFCRVFTRYDKLDASFLTFVYIAATAIIVEVAQTSSIFQIRPKTCSCKPSGSHPSYALKTWGI